MHMSHFMHHNTLRQIKCFGVVVDSDYKLMAIRTGMRLPTSNLGSGGFTERQSGIASVNGNTKGGLPSLALALINAKLNRPSGCNNEKAATSILNGDSYSPARTFYQILAHKDYGRVSWFYKLLKFEIDSSPQERAHFVSKYFGRKHDRGSDTFKVTPTNRFPPIYLYLKQDEYSEEQLTLTDSGTIHPTNPFAGQHLETFEEIELVYTSIYEQACLAGAKWSALKPNKNHSTLDIEKPSKPSYDSTEDVETKERIIRIFNEARHLFDPSEGHQSILISTTEFENIISIKGGLKTINLKAECFEDLFDLVNENNQWIRNATTHENDFKQDWMLTSFNNLRSLCLELRIIPSEILHRSSPLNSAFKAIESIR